jgi:hypothetical protein
MAMTSSTFPPEYISAITAPARGCRRGKRGGHRQKRNCIDAQPPGDEITADRNGKLRNDRDRCQRPPDVRQAGSASQMRGDAGCHDCNDDQ